MPDIYTQPWYEAVKDTINQEVTKLKDIPDGKWVLAVEIVADGVSPYVGGGADGAANLTATGADERHFLIEISDGRCNWYKEVEGDYGDVELSYRFRGPATVFDEIAAGITDPIDAALKGAVKVRGDMRLLMRQAKHVKVLLEAYSKAVDTSWPKGKPPYA
ncbi:MAG: SCP2 sterol-binding domain-containing protein [Actinobacteria bacterium]|jgi:putative sterol carrier protein|nr:SCP2 sterol-binding domain-containing protein [Actinomycetota bacterium]MCL6104343.1 SCP2 sterol-binding domain-containing protein [Actinomycetota bacterium]